MLLQRGRLLQEEEEEEVMTSKGFCEPDNSSNSAASLSEKKV